MFKLTILVSICLFVVALGAPQTGRIIGGKTAKIGQFPYQVSLRLYGEHLCGGSIINSRWILTAAHCVYQTGAPESFTVVAGTNILIGTGVSYDVEKFINHAEFNGRSLKNDIAVIKLAKDIKFTKRIQPVELLAEYVPAGKELVLSGWGSTSSMAWWPSDILKFVHLLSFDLEQCKSELKNVNIVHDTNICSFTKEGEGSCYGDSGGPLVLSTGEQVGIVSWGKPCAQGKPDVYTRVSSYYDWIQEQIEA